MWEMPEALMLLQQLLVLCVEKFGERLQSVLVIIPPSIQNVVEAELQRLQLEPRPRLLPYDISSFCQAVKYEAERSAPVTNTTAMWLPTPATAGVAETQHPVEAHLANLLRNFFEVLDMNCGAAEASALPRPSPRPSRFLLGYQAISHGELFLQSELQESMGVVPLDVEKELEKHVGDALSLLVTDGQIRLREILFVQTPGMGGCVADRLHVFANVGVGALLCAGYSGSSTRSTRV